MKMTPELAVKILRASEQECWLNGWDKGAAVDYVYNLANKWAVKALEKEPCEDAVSRQAVLDELRTCFDTHSIYDENNGENYIIYEDAVDMMEKLPAVTPTHSGWIPMIRREPTDEEKAEYLAQNGEELGYMLENKMPLNRQEVLVSIGELVSEDVFYEDFYNFENNDIENVDAWMPKPTAYAEEMEKANGKN